MPEHSKHELNFIDQYARKLCVDWARAQVRDGHLPDEEFSDEAIAKCPYKSHALRKGWLGKRMPRKLTASGLGRAVAWLKK